MPKPAPKSPRPAYRCAECGWETGKWVGRCGECQAWGSVAEAAAPTLRTAAAPVTTKAVPIGEVSVSESAFRTSGVPELDRVLGGGLVPGAAILLAGEPGVGKSTLLLEVAAQTARTRHRTLYVTGEESASQVRLRADRTGGVHDELYLAAETDLGAVLTHIEEVRPTLLVVDSVQTIGASGIEGVPGGVTQVKEVAAALIRVAKTRNITTVMVGHVTKDGSIAGPRVLEHLVDVVLHFEGDRNSRFRMVRAMKNRFGPIDEVGCFDLSSDGINAVTDPTGLFVENHHAQVPGTCVAVTMEGRRPLLAEVQALVTVSALERPRRTTSGLDGSRMAMVMAVLQQHCGIRFHNQDVFASTVGGAKLSEPAVDLAMAVALASASQGTVPPRGVVAMGEIGLAGELRRVRDLPQRLAEAARLGFQVAVVPAQPGSRSPAWAAQRQESRMVDDMRVIEVPDVDTALRLLKLTDGRQRPLRDVSDG
ncbi:DNA repair protein RadA [Nocardioides lianchengensis]|uniref:DNA repair protein RadA n=1 Tax=Nocardioides lianchengensis TaxID=1045774 RepID=A0A1G6PHX4_9ACTN|nr:DNA repair protein RadA [Nocardioides lianchengensis]NYG11843.1 DNA repair protein RadA/Sms [Nocardioides lianchengensis]SDC79126.1 DNA repair protein RadA/Sms [Nocardioides lianchengensis]